MDKSVQIERIAFFTKCANRIIKSLNGLYEEYSSKVQVLKELKDINNKIAKHEARRAEIIKEIEAHKQKVYNYSIDLVKLSFLHPLKARRIIQNMGNRHALIAHYLEEQRTIDDDISKLQASRMDIFDTYPLLSDKDVQETKNSYFVSLEDLRTLCNDQLAPLTKRDYSNMFSSGAMVVPFLPLSLERELENVVCGCNVSEEFEI